MTRPISINIPHQLGASEARRRIDEGFGRFERELGAVGMARLEKSWTDDRLQFSAHVMGQGITGRLDVLDEAILLEVDLPNFLAAVAETIKGRLQKQGRLLLEKK